MAWLYGASFVGATLAGAAATFGESYLQVDDLYHSILGTVPGAQHPFFAANHAVSRVTQVSFAGEFPGGMFTTHFSRSC